MAAFDPFLPLAGEWQLSTQSCRNVTQFRGFIQASGAPVRRSADLMAIGRAMQQKHEARGPGPLLEWPTWATWASVAILAGSIVTIAATINDIW